MKTLLIAMLCLLPTLAQARTIHVEFSYSATADGFRLYQNGVQVCETTQGVNLIKIMSNL